MVAPPFVLNTPLADLAGTWLRLECCRGTIYVPLTVLIGAARPKARLRDVLLRLRCQECHDRPATVALIEGPAFGFLGAVLFARNGTHFALSGRTQRRSRAMELGGSWRSRIAWPYLGAQR